MSARMWQYTAIDYTRWPRTPGGLIAFLDGMDASGWEFVAQVGDMLVFRRRYPAPVAETEQKAASNG